MSGRIRSLIGLLVLTIAAAVAVDAFGELRSAATAMACCAKTDYSCAGMSAPDDCCQQMGHAAHRAAAGTVSCVGLSSVAPGIGEPLFHQQMTAPAAVPVDSASAFTRPHDPPHLHPYSLLI